MDPRQENLPLTALRGVASAWVVLHHMQPVFFAGAPAGLAAGLIMGQSAVDLFFVLSGFILVSIYGGMTLSAAPVFWLRRICRVYPLHLTIMAALATLALAMTMLHANRSHHDWQYFPLVLVLMQPFVPGASSWNAPSWSVGVELFCYALFPVAAGLLRRIPAPALVVTAVLLAVAETVVLRRWGGAIEGDGAVLRGLTGFYLGAVLGTLVRVGPPIGPWAGPVACWGGVAGVIAGLALDHRGLLVLAAAALIVGLSAERGPVARVLSAAWLVWLGRVSFSIYLLHGPLLSLLQRIYLPGGPAVHAAIFAMVLLPLSFLTYVMIEQPGRRLPGRWMRWRRATNLGGHRFSAPP